MTEAQQKWVPPPEGTPCWIEIPAVDVDAAKVCVGTTIIELRANGTKKFYSSIFPNWKFREHTAKGVAPLSFYEGSSMFHISQHSPCILFVDNTLGDLAG